MPLAGGERYEVPPFCSISGKADPTLSLASYPMIAQIRSGFPLGGYPLVAGRQGARLDPR